jgi:hypothetical protein
MAENEVVVLKIAKPSSLEKAQVEAGTDHCRRQNAVDGVAGYASGEQMDDAWRDYFLPSAAHLMTRLQQT